MVPNMSTHRNIFNELDDAILFYPADVQTQPYRLTIDFTALAYQRDLVLDLSTQFEHFNDGDLELLGGLLGHLDDIFEQRIPNPGGPQ